MLNSGSYLFQHPFLSPPAGNPLSPRHLPGRAGRRVTRQSSWRPPPPYPPPQAGEGAEHRRQSCAACASLAASEAGGGSTEPPYRCRSEWTAGSSPAVTKEIIPRGDEPRASSSPARGGGGPLIADKLTQPAQAWLRGAVEGVISPKKPWPGSIVRRTNRVARRTKPRSNDDAFAARRSHAAFAVPPPRCCAWSPSPVSRGRMISCDRHCLAGPKGA